MARQGAVAQGRYRMKHEGQPSHRGLQGMFVLKENSGCQVYKPTWQGTRTVFRPFPGKDPENPDRWDPFRISDEEGDWGDWIRRYDVAFSFGNTGVTFILKDPRDDSVDVQQNPVWLLYRAITQAVKTGSGEQSWNPLIFGATGRAAPLHPPKDGYVMQGILMEHKSQIQNPPKGCMMEHQPVVLLMTQSAGEALLEKLNEKKDDAWVWDDITALDGGKFIQFHQAGTQATATGGPRQMGAHMVGSDNKDNMKYEVVFHDSYNNISPTFAGIHELAQAHVRPWNEIIRLPSIEEQIRILCNAGIPASAIVYALGEVYGDLIPQSVYNQARGQSVSSSTPFTAAQSPMQPADHNPMQAADASPMTPQTTGPQADPGMPSTAAAPDRDSDVESQTQETQPSAAPPFEMQQGGNGAAEQPTHVAPQRSQETMAAIARARQRVQQAQSQPNG